MTRPSDPPNPVRTPSHPGLDDLFRYPLMSAIGERRSRRVARGTSVEAAGLSHESANDPAPLSALEEAILIVSTGLTGIILHDGPLQRVDGSKELGTPMLKVLGRATSSPDNAQGTHFFMINDEAIWLIRKLNKVEAMKLLRDLPPNRREWSENDWLDAARVVKKKVYDGRLEFPRRFPYYHVWNKRLSNLPGTTILMPIVDCTRGMINLMLNVLSEPDGERAVIVDDWQRFRPKGFTEMGAWLASGLGLIPQKIPYQPVGGIEWARSGYLNPEINVPLGLAHAWRMDYESFLHMQNLLLIGQGLGLGGWMHATIFPPYIYERDEDTGHLGLGFRMHEPKKKWHHWPPTPASLPNPVGIDGVLEGLCPPYVNSMDDVVDQVLDEKYGDQGTYGDRETFARAYRNQEFAEEFLREAEPYPEQSIEYVRTVCKYIFDTYGRYPTHVDAFYLPGVWLQFSHLETEYYEKFYNPDLFKRQAAHDRTWGDH